MVISEKDLSLIEHYIECYGLQGGSDAHHSQERDMEKILKPWLKAKSEYLLPMFGNQLILEREVEYTKPESQLVEAIDRALYRDVESDLYVFEKKYTKWIKDTFGLFTDEASYLYNLLEPRALALNHIPEHSDTKVIALDENSSIKIQPGTKPMKLLAKIAKHIKAETEFENARLEHSRLLNQKKLKGTLCLSIHPLDYMTMSDNANRWSSCMNWTNGPGDYRQGTVEMMNSPMVVVGYLRDANEMSLGYPHEYWNSKKWRSLFIVNENAILSVKDYPFYCPELLQMCTEWLRDLANVCENVFPYPTQIIPIDNTFEYVDGEKYFVSPSTDCASMYNDFNCTKAHYGSLSIKSPKIDDYTQAHKIAFNYAGLSECMWCGDTFPDFYEDSYVVCTDCCTNAYYEYCDCCGAELGEDDAYWLNDVPMCWDCYCDHTEECAISGDRYDREDMATVYLLRDGEDTIDENTPCARIYDWYLTAYRPPNSNFSCIPHYDELTDKYFWYESDITKPHWYFPI